MIPSIFFLDVDCINVVVVQCASEAYVINSEKQGPEKRITLYNGSSSTQLYYVCSSIKEVLFRSFNSRAEPQ